MKHTLRVNVQGRGYILYSGGTTQPFQEFPLDVQSWGISRNYLSAQKRIDELLETHYSRWHFCIANKEYQQFPVVAYGCLLPIEDDNGRVGVSFIHAIETDESIGVDDLVVFVIRLLSPPFVRNISKLIADVATGGDTPVHLFNFLTSMFVSETTTRISPRSSINSIKKIVHDCGGASAVAWLAMAISHLESPVPWEIWEEYSQQDDLISTISSFSGAVETLQLSKYLYQLIINHHLRVPHVDRNELPYSRIAQNDSQTEGKISSKFSHPRSDGKNVQEDNGKYPQSASAISDINVSPNFSNSLQRIKQDRQCTSNQLDNFPSDGQIVCFKDLINDQLILSSDSKNYRINSRKNIYISEEAEYYKFVIVRSFFFKFKKESKLILQKKNLNDIQIKKIEKFLRMRQQSGKIKKENPENAIDFFG